MSFFDDEDDATEEEPTRPAPSAGARPRGSSSASRSGSRSGPPRRPSTRDPAVERRRWVAFGLLFVVVVLMILLISSCQARNTKTSLEDYDNGVYSLINRSDATGRQVFRTLSSGSGGAAIQSALATPQQAANDELSAARKLSVPGQMSAAQSHLVLALEMRANGIYQITHSVAQVSGSSAGAATAVAQIAAATAQFYASDVVYKDYAAPEIASALHGDSIAVGGASNLQINAGQFLTDLGWLQESFITTKLGVTASAGTSSSVVSKEDQPGLHGDALDSVAIGSNTLSSTGTNTAAGSPAPSFTLSVTNGGDFEEYDVGCSVSISGGPSGKSSIAAIPAGATATCSVTLSSTVPAGTYQVTATVAKVPLETNLANNTATYSVQFQ